MSYAASSNYSKSAYVPPPGSSPVTQVGAATYHFLNIPITFQTWQFIGLAYLVFVVARHWGRFVNEIT